MRSISITNIVGDLTLAPYGNGVRLTADAAMILIDGREIAAGGDGTGTPVPPVIPPGTGYLQPSYFTADELRADTLRVRPANAVQCDVTLLWPGSNSALPILHYGTAANNYTVNIMNPADLPQPPAVPPNKPPIFTPPPVNPPPSGGFVGQPLPGPSPQDQNYTVMWPASGQARFQTYGFCNQRVAFKVTVPAGTAPTTGALGSANTAEVPGQSAVFREMTVSYSPNDFESGTYLLSTIGNPDIGPRCSFSVGAPGSTADVNFVAGNTYYFNYRNAYQGKTSCDMATCDMLFDFAIPNR